MLADASVVPAFIRLCGATFGHGCAMGLQAGGRSPHLSPRDISDSWDSLPSQRSRSRRPWSWARAASSPLATS